MVNNYTCHSKVTEVTPATTCPPRPSSSRPLSPSGDSYACKCIRLTMEGLLIPLDTEKCNLMAAHLIRQILSIHVHIRILAIPPPLPLGESVWHLLYVTVVLHKYANITLGRSLVGPSLPSILTIYSSSYTGHSLVLSYIGAADCCLLVCCTVW